MIVLVAVASEARTVGHVFKKFVNGVRRRLAVAEG